MTEQDDGLREYSRALFAGQDDQTPPPEEPTTPSNHVPNEGNNPKGKANDMQTFAAHLFDRALRD